jgi:hypothetical protein
MEEAREQARGPRRDANALGSEMERAHERKGEKRGASIACLARPYKRGFYINNRQETVRVSSESSKQSAGI